MKNLLRLLLQPLALAFYGLLALSLVVWWIGPVLGFGEHHPLQGALARLSVIILLLLVYLVFAGLALLRRKRSNAALVQGLRAGAQAADREAEVLGQRFEQALKVLEDSARKTGKRSRFGPRQYLYELPWYVFIGAPGSGKTTALLNAGLNFPLAEKMGQASVKGVGGTRNCDWWFTDSAVLIDTAGRYTLQQSDQQVDAAAWERFLDLLKKTRPRRPLNGVLLTVNVQDLLQQNPGERKEHAAKLRARLQELHARLGVRPPVYVLVTKCDLIAGFNESFETLGKEQREQVWGFSLPYDPRDTQPPLKEFASEFAALEKRLRDRLLARIEAEREPLKRAAVFAFPQQFAGLRGLLGSFLEQVFDGSGALEQRSLLRGIYFTSGTQEGTPIDRVLGTLARTFGVDARAASIASARGKSYFLTRLLRDVVFAEQGLVGENRAAEAARRRRRMLAVGAMGLCGVLMLGGWLFSYFRNASYVAQVQARVPDLQAAARQLPPAVAGSGMGNLPQLLDQLDAAAGSERFDVHKPPLLNGLGLYQGDELLAAQRIGYDNLLQHALLPRVASQFEARLRAVDSNNLELAYDALKAYLMLYSPEHLDPQFLHDWTTLGWENNLAKGLTEQQRESLAHHLDAALALGAPRAIAPMDKALVARVRDMLAAYPLEYRVLSELEREGVGADVPEFNVATAAGPQALQVFQRTSGKPLTRGIPGLYTREGYFGDFDKAVGKVEKQLAEEQPWVLGIGSTSGAAANLLHGDSELDQRVRRLYLERYIKAWDGYLADVHLVQLSGLQQSLSTARILAAPDSPLVAYLRAVARETSLAAQAREIAAKRSATAGKLASAGGKALSKNPLGKLLGGAAQPKNDGGGDAVVEQMVDDHFANLHRLVQGQPAPIDDTLKMFNDVYAQLNAIEVARTTQSAPPPAAAMAALRASAGLQPEPVRTMLQSLINAGADQSSSAERQNLTSALKSGADFCARAIAGRYPFAHNAKADVLPADFGNYFGVGGTLDDFFNQNLAARVDTAANPWRYKPLPDGSIPPGGGALVEFQRAQRIRQAFFPDGGKQPGFKVELRLVSADAGLQQVTVQAGSQKLVFNVGDRAAQSLSWPTGGEGSQLLISGGAAPLSFEGPWALFRLLDHAQVHPGAQPEKLELSLDLGGRKAQFELISSSALNPLRMPDLASFRCPSSL